MTEEQQLPPIARAWRFLQKPRSDKFGSFHARWTRLFPGVPIPVRLSFGGWFLARNDFLGSALIRGEFERAEQAFVRRFVGHAMTVLDIGANQGLYTLLASKRVGPEGSVIAFEPSPREQQALRLNLRLNRCRNVLLEGVALGDSETPATAQLYVVDQGETGCNSLRPPVQAGSTSMVPIRVTSLDQFLAERRLESVDFIKLDVEGAELSVLQGAQRLFERYPRPVVLSEVQDVRTQAWNYPAREIVKYLSEREYNWFALSNDSSLVPLDTSMDTFNGNFVAFPQEVHPTGLSPL